MKKRRHTPDQIVRKLRIADQLQADGKDQAEIAKHLEVSEATLHRWRNQFGGMKANDAKRLKELEKENTQLKRIVADQQLENVALYGGGGANSLLGRPGSDRLWSRAGNDAINSNDGEADNDDCGLGTDSVKKDSFDAVSNC